MLRHFPMTGWALIYTLVVCTLYGRSAQADDGPEVPRIDSVVMSSPQPQASDESVIWYNDFANLRWLGNKPTSQFRLHSTQESGRWVCVETRAKLNTPGRKDGLNQLWIDGRLETERKNLDWRSSLLTVAERVQVGAGDGSFVGPLANKSQLDAGRVYYFRDRQESDTGLMSDWSPWHQSERTVDESAKPARSG